MVNITDLYGVDFDNLMAELEKEFSWTGADYFTDSTDGVVEQWMSLLSATRHSTWQQTDSNSSTEPSSLVSVARNL